MTANNSGGVRKYDGMPKLQRLQLASHGSDSLDDLFEEELPVMRIYSLTTYQRYVFVKKK